MLKEGKKEKMVLIHTQKMSREKKIKGRVQERSPMRKGAVVGVSPKLCWRILEKGKDAEKRQNIEQINASGQGKD